MLVIQRSFRKSASLVEAREQTHQHNHRCVSCVAERKNKKVSSAPTERQSDTNSFQYAPAPVDIFLQGKSVLLQHRLSSKIHVIPQSYRSKPVTSPCENNSASSLSAFPSRREKHGRKKKYKSEAKTRPSSLNLCNESESRRTVLRQRKRKARTPLLMSTMNLPNENLATLTSKEASKRHLSREDAKATLERLLATRNHQLPTTSTSKSFNATGEAQLVAGEKSAYLQDSYDYLFQRHLHNLNSVIHSFNQQEINETTQSNQKQKKRVDIYQNCCGGNDCCEHKLEEFQQERNNSTCASVPSVRATSKCDDCFAQYSNHCNSEKTYCLQSDSCEEDPQVYTEIDNNSNLLTPASGEYKSVHRVGTFSEDHAANFRSSSRSGGTFEASSSAMENQNVKATSSTGTNESRAFSGGNKKNGGFLCINVSNQFQDIHLEEVEPAVSKPVITLNHVSESFSSEKCEISTLRTDRSPSPLLVVPPPTDIQQESLRPPLD